MNLFSLNAPQLGEGLKYIEVVAFLKAPGESIQKDEPVVLVETEKATMEIESPVSGVIHEFRVPLHSRVPVGNELITINTATSPFPFPKIDMDDKNIDTSHAGGASEILEKLRVRKACAYTEETVALRQVALIKAMRASERCIIPALIHGQLDAGTVKNIRKSLRAKLSADLVPTSTEIISWAILEAMKHTPRFCSTMLEDDKTVHHFDVPSIGIAMSLPDDELTTLKISADEYDSFDQFIKICKTKNKETKAGVNHNGIHSISISDMTSLHIHSAYPVIVSPASSTIVIGKFAEKSCKDQFSISLAFDHRLINGAGAARFILSIGQSLSHLGALLIPPGCC